MSEIKWIIKRKKNYDTLAGQRLVSLSHKTMTFSQDMVEEFGEKVNIGLDYKSGRIYFSKGDINGYALGGRGKNRIIYPSEMYRFIRPFLYKNIGLKTLFQYDQDTYYICLEA